MRNQYAGVCFVCGETVEPGEGHFEKQTRNDHVLRMPDGKKLLGRWRVRHTLCDSQSVPRKQAKPVTHQPR